MKKIVKSGPLPLYEYFLGTISFIKYQNHMISFILKAALWCITVTPILQTRSWAQQGKVTCPGAGYAGQPGAPPGLACESPEPMVRAIRETKK